MRKLKQISLAVAIVLALSTGAMAGIIECPPAPATAPGIIDTPPSAQSVDVPSNPVVNVALNLLQSALTLF